MCANDTVLLQVSVSKRSDWLATGGDGDGDDRTPILIDVEEPDSRAGIGCGDDMVG
jgi:hypothetical protein